VEITAYHAACIVLKLAEIFAKNMGCPFRNDRSEVGITRQNRKYASRRS
jgi:hypothetical protein